MIRRVAVLGNRRFATDKALAPTYHDMRKTKHDFVKFVNNAVLDKKSVEAHEMYKYLVNCFIDNDTDYDGQVSFRGFNSMVAEAALAPRRFGFAPHTREQYATKEEYEKERLALFNELCGGNERVSLENWLNWAHNHLELKVGKGLQEHNECRWERSKDDYVNFLKGVLSAKSTHCRKSSTSTQMKEHYLNSVRQFTSADDANRGKLDAAGVGRLKDICQKLPSKFGLTMYEDMSVANMSSSDSVSLKDFLDYKLNHIETKIKAGL